VTSSKSPIIGIDLGTYNSAACVLLGGEPVLLRPEEGATEQGMCFPSAVEFDDAGEPVQAGERARRSLPVYPHSVVWGVKRLIGRPYEAARASGDIDRYAYRIEKDADGGCAIRVGRRVYTPRDVTTLILQKIKQDAEADFNPIGRSVSEAVITVPAYFDPVQKHETEQAALAAGFENVYLLPEPTAAASAHRVKVEQENQYVVVVDLGAGTLDVTVALLYLDDNGQLQTVEKGHGGDTALGGLDMDDALMRYATKRFGLQRLVQEPRGRMRLRTELERGKIELSTAETTEVSFAWQEGSVKLSLSRRELEDAVRPTVERCRGPLRVALQEAGLTPEDVTRVLLVGGPTLMPIVRQVIAEEFRQNQQVVAELAALATRGCPVHPMEAVARGAVLGVAGKISPHGYGLRMFQEYHELLPRRQRYPSRGAIGFQYWGTERTVDFDLIRQAVAPDTLHEEYTLLGTFQFDCVAEHGILEFEMGWEYTDNGVLHFEVRQAGGASMPLYDVSRLDGHKIARPVRHPHEAQRVPQADVRRDPWSAAELQQATHFGRQVLDRVRERMERMPARQRQQLAELCERLEKWLLDEAASVNHRTPHIRDLGRAILNLLYVGRLIDASELAALRREL
jgi:molecular chaperone DnaK